MEYDILLGFVCFWRAEIKKRGWKIDGDVEVVFLKVFEEVCDTCDSKKINRCLEGARVREGKSP